MTHTFSRAAFVIALAATSAAAQSLMASKGQVVLAVGDAAPGIPGATIGNTSPFDAAVMDLNGNILFRARMALGGPVTGNIDDRAVFFGRAAGDTALVVRSGDPEPSGALPGVTLNTATSTGPGSNMLLSPRNELIVFGSSLSGTGIVNSGTTGRNDSALFWGPRGALQLLSQRGDLAPAGGSTLNSSYSVSQQSMALNENGVTVFKATLLGGDVTGTADDTAWLIGTPGNLQFMLREGELINGGAQAMGSLGFGVMINDLGQVLHDESLSTTLGTTPATAADNSVLMAYTPGAGNTILMREGDVAPGTGGATFLNGPTLGKNFSSNGTYAFISSLQGGNVTGTTDDTAIFLGNVNGGLSVAVREGDAAPGVPGEFLGIFNNSSFTSNGSGQVAFVNFLAASANITTANDGCLYFGTPGSFQLIAREGDQAPGFPVGTVFGSTSGGGIGSGSAPQLNERGQIIFAATVIDPLGANTSCQFGYDPVGGLQLLIAADETITTVLGPQIVTNTGGVNFESGDGCPYSLNNNGDFCMRVFFAGGSFSSIIRCHLGGMMAIPSSMDSTVAGSQTIELNAGAAHAGQLYVVAGCASGSRPGQFLAGAQIPLNNDFWFGLTLANQNGAIYANSWGLLDGQGRGTMSFNWPGAPGLTGLSLHHAFVALDATVTPVFVSEPSTLLLY